MPKLLAGESMVVPTIRKHWIVMARTLQWPIMVALVLLVATAVVPALGLTRTGASQHISLSFDPTFIWTVLAIAVVVLVLLGIVGLELPKGSGGGSGLGPWVAILIGLLILTVLMRVFLGDLQIALSLILAAAIVGLAGWWSWLTWQAGTMTITDQRVVIEEGVLRRAAKVIPLDRVQDVSTTQTLLGRLLDYGSIEIDTAGAIPNELFNFARQPETLRDQVFVLSEQLRRGI